MSNTADNPDQRQPEIDICIANIGAIKKAIREACLTADVNFNNSAAIGEITRQFGIDLSTDKSNIVEFINIERTLSTPNTKASAVGLFSDIKKLTTQHNSIQRFFNGLWNSLCKLFPSLAKRNMPDAALIGCKNLQTTLTEQQRKETQQAAEIDTLERTLTDNQALAIELAGEEEKEWNSDALKNAIKQQQTTLKELRQNKTTLREKALIYAVATNDVTAVNTLIRAGADGDAALARAVTAGNEDAVDTLIRAGADGVKALVRAATSGNEDAVTTLINTGADVNPALDHAVKDNNVDAAKALIEAGADVNPALDRAVKDNNVDAAKALIEAGADVNHQDKDNNTALILAVQRGHTEIIETLLRMDANINQTGQFGYTPLHAAVTNERDKVVEILLKHNADSTKEDKYKRKPIDYCKTYLTLDPYKPHRKKIADLLTKSATNALAKAAKDNNVDAAKALIEAGADVNAALARAATSGNEDAVTTLINTGADVNAALDHAVKDNNEPALEEQAQAQEEVAEEAEAKTALEAQEEVAEEAEAKTALEAQAQEEVAKEAAAPKDAAAPKEAQTSDNLTMAARRGDFETVEQLITDGAELKYDEEGFGLAEAAAYKAWRAWGHAHPDENMNTITKGLADPKGIYCKLQAIVKTVQFLTCASLWDYAEKGDLERIKHWHQDMTQGSGKTLGLNINASNAQGDTALTIAAKHGNKEVIEWLVKEGSANIAHTQNKDQSDGLTALELYKKYCEEHEEVELDDKIISLLTPNEAEAEAALEAQAQEEVAEEAEAKTALEAQAQAQAQEEVAKEAEAKAANPKQQTTNILGESLLLAAQWGRTGSIKELLDHDGTDITYQNSDGDTALDLYNKYCEEHEEVELDDKIISLLTPKEAEAKAAANTLANSGADINHALAMATQEQNQTAIQTLSQAIQDKTQTNAGSSESIPNLTLELLMAAGRGDLEQVKTLKKSDTSGKVLEHALLMLAQRRAPDDEKKAKTLLRLGANIEKTITLARQEVDSDKDTIKATIKALSKLQQMTLKEQKPLTSPTKVSYNSSDIKTTIGFTPPPALNILGESLLLAAQWGRTGSIKELLDHDGTDITYQNSDGLTALDLYNKYCEEHEEVELDDEIINLLTPRSAPRP